MLTHRQRDTFRLAIANLRKPQPRGTEKPPTKRVIPSDKIFESEMTIEQFFGRYGQSLTLRGTRPVRPHELFDTAYGKIYKWEEAKSRSGEIRATLYVMDFGHTRAAYFEMIS